MPHIEQKRWLHLLLRAAAITGMVTLIACTSPLIPTDGTAKAEAQPESTPASPQRVRPSLYGTFRLGMTPQAVNALLYEPFSVADWDKLPIAREYSDTEVRYVWRKLDQFSNLPFESQYRQCEHGASYLTFLFDKNGLFRMSLRLMPDCENRQQIIETIAQQIGAPLTKVAGAQVFHSTVENFVMAGVAENPVSTLEWVRADAPKYDHQPW